MIHSNLYIKLLALCFLKKLLLSVLGIIIFAVAVGVLHMASPDHWATISVLGKTSNWTEQRLLGVTAIAGLGHILLSMILGIALASFAIIFSVYVSRLTTQIIGSVMLAIGLYIILIAFRPRQNKEETESPDYNANNIVRSTGYFAVMGAALSPDLSILPVFVAAIPYSFYVLFLAAAVFSLASMATIMILTYLSYIGLGSFLQRIPARYNDAMVGIIIMAVGIYTIILH